MLSAETKEEINWNVIDKRELEFQERERLNSNCSRLNTSANSATGDISDLNDFPNDDNTSKTSPSISLGGDVPCKPQTSIDVIRLRMEKAQRRRIQAQQKKELHKKKTIDRLLRKQQTKYSRSLKIKNGIRSKGDLQKKVRYVIGVEKTYLSFPNSDSDAKMTDETESDTIIEKKLPLGTTVQILCGIDGCQNPKKYNCSTTKLPLCSLECYKKNLANANIEKI